MITRVDEATQEFHKQAESPTEGDRLRHEAQVLGVARHPAVVQLLGLDDDELRLRLVAGDRLSDAAANEEAMAELAAAAATTLADLHEIGVVHRAIGAEHLLVTGNGQPIFCGFGRAAAGSEVGATDRADDVAALASCLLAGSATATVDGARHRILTDAARPGSRRPSARQLATLLATTTPAPLSRHRDDRRATRLARPALRAGAVSQGRSAPRRCRLFRTTALAALACVALVGVVALVAVVQHVHHAAGTSPDTTPPAACPVVDQGCGPLPRPDGVVQTAQGRYRIGQVGDLVVIGRWHCAGALPALLQPGAGDVWVWDSWAPGGAPVAARLAARVPNARSVRVDPGPSGCDRLQVIVPGGGAVVVPLDRIRQSRAA